jgi:hypothetical protein
MLLKKRVEPTTLTYADLDIPSVQDFDYSTYVRVLNYVYISRIGAGIVELGLLATLRRDPGAQGHSAPSTTSIGDRKKHLTSTPTQTSQYNPSTGMILQNSSSYRGSIID